MGLGLSSTGQAAADKGVVVEKQEKTDVIVALAGNPNVGKSTVFNELTGLNQHTGNWPGKTVATAQGRYEYNGRGYILVDLPGTYSLMAHSQEEEVARDFICFSKPEVTVIVCDGSCLERNLNLVLQTLEITSNAVVCVNLMDEAEKKNIRINFSLLSKMLGVPVIPTSARSRRGLSELMDVVESLAESPNRSAIKVRYSENIENAVRYLEENMPDYIDVNKRWLALRLAEGSSGFEKYEENEDIKPHILHAREGISGGEDKISDMIVTSIVTTAEKLAQRTVSLDDNCTASDRRLDRILAGRKTGIPVMILLLFFILWLTITGANYPSEMLSGFLFGFEEYILGFCTYINIPSYIYEPLVFGVYRVLAWVVSVMLPPMAIFFPLFTILEDFGYLPRVAFNLDKYFKKACTCGKQCLSMCMGFGCNAAGVVGCRIIDSPRERLIAMLTNSFVPCNGRFPTLISIITMFFIGNMTGLGGTLLSTLLLTAVIVLGVLMTFFVSRLLSKTVLKGMPSSFALELPPYRRPQIGKVIVRSIFDRTLFVLGRAVVAAAPAGLIIWLMANVDVNGVSALNHVSEFFDPFAYYLGLDGVILLAFILGFPANEIVVPIIIMAYMSNGVLVEVGDLNVLKNIFTDNGWTALTAVCMLIFSLMHWPCSTTCMTVKKESGSIKWTALAFMLPTVFGMLICATVAFVWRLFV